MQRSIKNCANVIACRRSRIGIRGRGRFFGRSIEILRAQAED
jgi:hypothetical protein